MATPNVENLESKNSEYASSFTQGELAPPPSRKLAVVTCMVARIDPAAAFPECSKAGALTESRVSPLGGAHVFRNASGSAREAHRSLVISKQLLGTTEIHIIKHTGYGMLTFANEDARGVVEKNLGSDAASEVSNLDLLPFPELDRAVKDDIQFLKDQKSIPDSVSISGWIYEVETGKVRQV